MITLRKKIGLCSLITLLVNGCSYQANINRELIKHSNQPHIYVNEAITLVDDRSDILRVFQYLVCIIHFNFPLKMLISLPSGMF